MSLEERKVGRHAKHAQKACNHCRARKGKCNGNGVDPCQWCVDRTLECTYNPEDARGPVWSKQAMESHLELERSLREQNNALAAEVQNLKEYIKQHINMTEAPSIAQDVVKEEDVDSVIERTRHLVLHPNKSFALHSDWSPWVNVAPSRPAISFQNRTPNASSPFGSQEDLVIDYSAAIYELPDAWRKGLPPEAVMSAQEHNIICDLFFKFYSSWGLRIIPFLFWRDMHRAIQEEAPATSLRTAHWSPFLHNALLSVAAAFSDNSQVRARQNREFFANRAKSEIEKECVRPTISSVTGLGLLASFHSTLNEHALGFMYFGICIRVCRALGLNVKCHQWVKDGYIGKEDQFDRRWGFWSTYATDVWWSLYVGREVSLNIGTVTIKEPAVDILPRDPTPWTLRGVDEPPRSNLYTETFVETTKLAMLAAKIMDVVYGLDRRGNYLNSNLLHSINVELNDWYSLLPRSLALTHHPMPHILMLHLAFWWCIILLHRPSYKLELHSAEAAKSVPRKLCLRAAKTIMDIIDRWRARYTLRYVPVKLMSVIYAAGTTWLLAAAEPSHGDGIRDRHLRYADKCVEYLEETGTLLECGAELRRILARLISELRLKLQNKKHTNGHGIRKHSNGGGQEGFGKEERDRYSHLPGKLSTYGIEASREVDAQSSSDSNSPNYADIVNHELSASNSVLPAFPQKNEFTVNNAWPPGGLMSSSDLGMRAGDSLPNEPSLNTPLPTDFPYLYPSAMNESSSAMVGWDIWPESENSWAEGTGIIFN